MITLEKTNGEKKITPELETRLKSNLDYWAKLSHVVHLTGTRCLVNDLVKDLDRGLRSVDEIDAKIDSIQVITRDELKSRSSLYVPQDRADYYNNKLICGAVIAEKFPDALPEVIEAGNCYALDRPTACVFHLMRVIPYGMAATAKLLKVKYPRDIKLLDWHSIIEPIEKAIREMGRNVTKTPKKNRDMKDFSEIAQHLNFCKDAWRNHVSHSIERYDMPQAKSVMDHVALIMKLVGKRLKKPFTGLH